VRVSLCTKGSGKEPRQRSGIMLPADPIALKSMQSSRYAYTGTGTKRFKHKRVPGVKFPNCRLLGVALLCFVECRGPFWISISEGDGKKKEKCIHQHCSTLNNS
jgi:hypothetical protein